MYRVNGKEYQCSIMIVQDIFNDKWKIGIIWHLMDGAKRYKELNEQVSDITQKTLTIKLRELEEHHIIERQVFPEIPPKVVYSLSPIGEKLRPLMQEMFDWGVEYVKEFGQIDETNQCETKLTSKSDLLVKK